MTTREALRLEALLVFADTIKDAASDAEEVAATGLLARDRTRAVMLRSVAREVAAEVEQAAKTAAVKGES